MVPKTKAGSTAKGNSTAKADPKTKAGSTAEAGSTARVGSTAKAGSTVKRLALVLAAIAAVLLGTAVPASAHAALLGSDPAEGSVVRTAPAEVTLRFSEGVLLSDDSLLVYDPSGRPVQRGTAHHASGRPDSATVALRGGLRTGTYTVAWKAISADTHPVSGAWTFSVGAPSRTSAIPKQAQAGGGPAGALYGIGRYVAYLGYALMVGSACFLGVCWPRGTRLRAMRRLTVTGWAALTSATIVLLLLRGPYVNGTGLGGILDPTGLQAAVETKAGAALVSRLLLLAAAAVFLSVLFGGYARREDPRERRDLALGLAGGGVVLAVGIAATWSVVEHASVGVQPGLAMPLDVAHLLAMAGWTGGLAALLTALYRGPGIDPTAVRRFSGIAFGCVCVLVTTGLYQSWRQVGSWHALPDTSYGRWLLVKVSLVTCLMGTALVSKRRTGRLAGYAPPVPADAPDASGTPVPGTGPEATPVPGTGRAGGIAATAPVADDPLRAAQLARQRSALTRTTARKRRDADPAMTGLRRSVLVEVAVAVLVLAATTMLSGTEPGRAVEEAAAAGRAGGASGAPASGGGPVLLSLPYDTGGPKGKGNLGVHLTPARTGSDEMHLTVTDPVGDPVDVPEVDASLTLRARNLGPLPVRLRHTGPGSWAATGLQLPMPGSWQLAVTVRTDAIDEVTVTRNVEIG